MAKDGLLTDLTRPWLVGQYNDAMQRPFWRRNEVWVPLADFKLWPRDQK